MLLDVGNKQYAVHFLHGRETDVATEPAGSQFQSRITFSYHTQCSLHEGKCVVKGCASQPRLLSGIAYCHPNDQFSKAAGRKVSLSRAIAGLPRETRRMIWAAYFKQCPHK